MVGLSLHLVCKMLTDLDSDMINLVVCSYNSTDGRVNNERTATLILAHRSVSPPPHRGSDNQVNWASNLYGVTGNDSSGSSSNNKMGRVVNRGGNTVIAGNTYEKVDKVDATNTLSTLLSSSPCLSVEGIDLQSPRWNPPVNLLAYHEVDWNMEPVPLLSIPVSSLDLTGLGATEVSSVDASNVLSPCFVKQGWNETHLAMM